MAENNVNQVQPANVQVPAEEPKRVRVGYIFLSLVPVAVLLAIQTVTQIPFMAIAMAETVSEAGGNPGDVLDTMMRMSEVFNAKYAVWAYMLYGVIALIVFGSWYIKSFVKGKPRFKFSSVFGFKSVLATVGIVIGLTFTIDAGMTLASWLVPDVMDSYKQLIEASGLVDNVLITVIYGILMGPVLEELALRGLTFGYLEKSNIKPFFVILISGILFGAMHMNLVQGIYASFLGFFLGYLRYKYRSISITIICHILFNLMGTYGSEALSLLNLKEGAVLILGGISLFILAFAIVLINGDAKAYHAE
jgi:membrane protease YdiL (CAAX protease family)